MNELESWRPALIAFYRAEGSFQSADNLEKLRMPLSARDRQTIRALKAKRVAA